MRAVDEVTLAGYPGEVLAICGANGAGKSTLAKLLSGQEAPTSGQVLIAGASAPVTTPSQAADAGVLFMHQEPLVIEDFTIAENVWLSQLSAQRGNHAFGLTGRNATRRTLDALAAVGMDDVGLQSLAGELAPGSRQMLALSRTQVQPHNILILDETTASTTEEHFKVVTELVRREREAGVCVVFVSHRMDEVFSMADRIAVLRGGRLVDTLVTERTTRDEVVTLMIGEAIEALEPPAPITHTPVSLVTDSLVAGAASGISLEAHEGEILGIYGLVGSGRSSLARAITGQIPIDDGSLEIEGRPAHFHSNRDAIARGVVYLSEDRKREGFVADFSNGFNMTLATLPKFSTAGVIDLARERAHTEALSQRYQVKGGPEVLTATLSGGNQQKVCIARWLEADPRIVVLDEPTKGVDVGARLNLYSIIRDLADQGLTVLVVSSEADELLSLCHRIVVLRNGRLVSEHDSHTSSTDDLIRAALEGEAA